MFHIFKACLHDNLLIFESVQFCKHLKIENLNSWYFWLVEDADVSWWGVHNTGSDLFPSWPARAVSVSSKVTSGISWLLNKSYKVKGGKILEATRKSFITVYFVEIGISRYFLFQCFLEQIVLFMILVVFEIYIFLDQSFLDWDVGDWRMKCGRHLKRLFKLIKLTEHRLKRINILY